MNNSHHILIERLRYALAQREITQLEIAQATGVDQSQVSRILAGSVKRISENVQKLCAYARTLPDAKEGIEDKEKEAFDLLSDLLKEGPEIQSTIVDLMRNILIFKRQCEHRS